MLSKSNSVRKEVFILFSGQLVSNLISFLFSFILIKLYSPEAIGLYASLIGICTMLSFIAPLGMDSLIVIEKRKETKFLLFSISFFNSFIFSIIILLFLLVLLFFNIQITGFEKFNNLIFLVPLLTFFLGIYNTYTYLYNDLKGYKAIKNGGILRTFFFNVLSVIIGYFNPHLVYLFTSQFLGVLIVLTYFSKPKLVNFIIKTFFQKSKDIGYLIKKHRSYAFFETSSNLFSSIEIFGISAIIFILFGAKIAGFYFIGEKLLERPLSFLSSSISKVFYQRGTLAFNNSTRELQTLMKKIQKKLFFILLPFTFLISFSAPYIFKLISPKWIESGTLIKYFSIAIFTKSMIGPFTFVFNIIRRVDLLLYFNILLASTRILILIITSKIYSFEKSILICSIAISLCYLGLNYFINSKLNKLKKDT